MELTKLADQALSLKHPEAQGRQRSMVGGLCQLEGIELPLSGCAQDAVDLRHQCQRHDWRHLLRLALHPLNVHVGIAAHTRMLDMCGSLL